MHGTIIAGEGDAWTLGCCIHIMNGTLKGCANTLMFLTRNPFRTCADEQWFDMQVARQLLGRQFRDERRIPDERMWLIGIQFAHQFSHGHGHRKDTYLLEKQLEHWNALQ